VLEDVDREKKQTNMLVGSLNAANKFIIGRGKMQKLSGLIITKNIHPENASKSMKSNVCYPYSQMFVHWKTNSVSNHTNSTKWKMTSTYFVNRI
jgi:hypothetical protein